MSLEGQTALQLILSCLLTIILPPLDIHQLHPLLTSPSMSPLTINTDNESEHGYTPPQHDGTIITRAAEIFDLPNDDSDNELD